MTGNARNQTLRTISLTVAAIILCSAFLSAQESSGISPLSDYMYKKDLDKYEAIKKEANSQKRGDMLIGLLKERPISRLLLYIATDYMETLKPLIDQKNYTQFIAKAEALQALLPTQQTVNAAQIPVGVEDFMKDQLQPTQKLIFTSLAGAYYESKNLAKAAELGEQAYKLAPNDKSLVIILFNAYNQLNNEAKLLTYGNKMLEIFPIAEPQGYGTALQMAQIYIKKQDVKSATQLYTKVMGVYGDKTPAGWQEGNWNQTRLVGYTLMAQDEYNQKDYPNAEKLYQKVLSLDPKRDDAYYFLGMCRWQSKDQVGAIGFFARSVVLNKTYAQKARKYLEDLYKAEHNNSLDGLDQALAKAKSELGI